MILRFRREAVEEFAEAVSFYNMERAGLGFEFSLEVKNSIQRMKNFPESWPKISQNIRKCIINRFPYALLYHKNDERILVVAVMHLSRKPGYWKNRI